MYQLLIICLCSLAFFTPSTMAKNFTIEAESVPHGRESITRTRASNMKSILFENGATLRVDFCLRKTTNVTVASISFSNDGASDQVSIDLDGDRLGSFNSTSNSNRGRNWNVFEERGPIGTKMELSPARHSLGFTFVTDVYGFELDFILLIVEDENLEEDLLRCMAVCDANIKFSDIKARDDIVSAKLVQASHTTFCVKDKNIKYHLLHETANEYRVTAKSPEYKTLLNDDISENFGCDTESDVIWEFTDFTILPTESAKTAGIAQLTFGGTNTAIEITSNFTFAMGSSSTRQPDEEVRSVLTLTLESPVPTFTALLTHSSRTGVKTNVAPSSTTGGTVKWNITDSTWIRDANNDVTITISVAAGAAVTAEVFKLERGGKQDDVNVTLFRDSETVILAVREDQTPLAGRHPGMVVQQGAQTYLNITRIKVSKVNRFTDGYNEILQISQDGLTNIKPMVLYGADFVPYGTSLLIGQFNASEANPSAPISTVVLDPFSLILYIGYVSGNVATIEINSKLEDTEIHVTNVTFNKDRSTHPIAAVVSTWVSDGNADLDHVSANLNEPHLPLDDWKTLYGTAFAFFRQCVSHHNTQAPDLVLELLHNNKST